MASLDEAAHLAAYDRDRTLVSAHGRMARRFASRFTWSTTVNKVHALLAALPADPSQRPRYKFPTMVRLRGYWQRVRHYSALVSQSLRRHGVGGTCCVFADAYSAAVCQRQSDAPRTVFR